jgi:hypothetical protein
MAPTSTEKNKSAKSQKAGKKGNKAAVIGTKPVRQHSGNQPNPATPPLSENSDKEDAESVIEIDGDAVMDDVGEIDDEEELGKSPVTRVIVSETDGITERLAKDWQRPIYAFFDAVPIIEHVDGRRCHAFRCNAKGCKNKTRFVRRFLDKKDARSTSNMRKHAKNCWGADVVAAADKALNATEVRNTTVKGALQPGLITAAFERNGRGKVTYSHRQHTRAETRHVVRVTTRFDAQLSLSCRAEIVRWVSENMRPLTIVEDPAFHTLMKTGRLDYYIPSATTVGRDVKMVFAKSRSRIAKMLQSYPGKLNFATDAWTSPNHKAFIAITVHIELDGEPLSFLLDIIEVARSHSGFNLAVAFAGVLESFGIEHKVRRSSTKSSRTHEMAADSLYHMR